MKLNITGQNITLTDALNQHIERKFSKLNQHINEAINASIILIVEKNDQIIEATIHLNGNDLFASAKTDDMYLSVNQLVKKLDTQIIKHNQKNHNHRG